MSVPEEFRNKLRESLLGKNSSLVQESVQKITVETKKPFQYWKGEIKEDTAVKSPFKWNWGVKRGYNTLEDSGEVRLTGGAKPPSELTEENRKKKYEVI